MPLYTDFHKRLGYADLWAMSNIQAFYGGYKVMFGEKHLLGGTIYKFDKAEDEGLSYSPLTGGNGVFVDCPPTGGASRTTATATWGWSSTSSTTTT